MQLQLAKSKQTNRSWVAIENALNISRATQQHVSIPYATQHDCLNFHKDFSIACVWAWTANSGAGNPVFSRMRNPSGSLNYGFLLEVFNFGSSLGNEGNIRALFMAGDPNINDQTYTVNFTKVALNKFSFIVFTWKAATKTGILSVNDVKYVAAGSLGTLAANTAIEIGPTPLLIGKANYSGLRHSSGIGCNFSFFNKTLTDFEVTKFSREIGIIPKDLHNSCYGFWPLNHRYGRKAYDCVELFNYAKTTFLTASHGDLLNYTDAEIGLPDRSTNSAWHNYYLKKPAINVLSFEGLPNDIIRWNNNQLIADTDSFTLEAEILFRSGSDMFAFSRGRDGFGGWSILTRAAPTFINIEIVSSSTQHVQYDFPFSFNLWTWYHLAYTFEPSAKRLRLYVNGQLVQTYVNAALSNLRTATFGCTLGGQTLANNHNFANRCVIKNFRFWNIARSQTEINSSQLTVLPAGTAGLKVQFPLQEESNGVITDSSGSNNHGTRTGALPPLGILNGLLLDATHTINFPLSGTVINYFKGYAVQAYRLKNSQTLQPGEKLRLENNSLFANPSKAILRKLDAYYLFNNIDTTAGNRVLDLINANHATLTTTDGSPFTITPLNLLR